MAVLWVMWGLSALLIVALAVWAGWAATRQVGGRAQTGRAQAGKPVYSVADREGDLARQDDAARPTPRVQAGTSTPPPG